ncbi:sorbin and SH3 domain-containing protein 1 isoform X17 [Leptidea sinapis]|uniref:sorbin and SH3 domain-containing protein 1 isoform X17 n=1 Tax=Leptidea sinapis TaxID=189913 RepID=UPI0021358FE9|nr:sorbin and SH3 domain-containing protein 1 isoform X17 [Leptidea sinapis]
MFESQSVKDDCDKVVEAEDRNVVLSGSLSKSLLALNKYVKENLLYDYSDEREVLQNDCAYFSQENSPNDSATSIVKSDTDRFQSEDLQSSDILINSSNNANSEDQLEPSRNDQTKLTDDYKFEQLLVNPKRESPKVASISSLDKINRKEERESDDNFAKYDIREEDNVDKHSKRHTVHDLSEWANRVNLYEDVYAPLPFKSPNRRYVESDVNIHYRIPVRHDPLPLVPERELARQQAEHMKRLYREQKRNKYLQENDINPIDIEAFDASIKELQDMQNRRHQDNFTPSQKAVVPLNRYDEAEKIVARALYTFNGQTSRELSFKKGELIHVRRQIDNNWYEGEIHGKVGLFPYNYVELLKGDVTQTPKKQTMIEGRARAKFDFTAQTNLELPLKKGEVVVLTRRIDHNWWEGRLGNKMGIFPDSYVTVIQEPSQNKPEARPILCTDKPVAAPAAHGLLNGSDKRSMGSHNYIPQPNSPALANAPPATQPLIGYPSKAAHPAQTPSERGYGPPTGAGVDLNNTEPLYVDTNAEAVPYRAMYKYRPQNPDELELNEGDTVYVLEKCDDGWYVGSSQRTGRFGTFPGNYVERI